MDMLFDLFNKNTNKRYYGEKVDLVQERVEEATLWNNYTKSIFYGIYLPNEPIKVGKCDLRLGMNEELYYAGNIGYRINELYQGHHYAYYACLLLFEIAKKDYGMKEMIITCSPDNTASRKTLEKLEGEFVETAKVPTSHWLYKRGETIKNIYHYEL